MSPIQGNFLSEAAEGRGELFEAHFFMLQ